MKQSDGFCFETPEQGGTNQVKGVWWCGDYYGQTCHAILSLSAMWVLSKVVGCLVCWLAMGL